MKKRLSRTCAAASIHLVFSLLVTGLGLSSAAHAEPGDTAFISKVSERFGVPVDDIEVTPIDDLDGWSSVGVGSLSKTFYVVSDDVRYSIAGPISGIAGDFKNKHAATIANLKLGSDAHLNFVAELFGVKPEFVEYHQLPGIPGWHYLKFGGFQVFTCADDYSVYTQGTLTYLETGFNAREKIERDFTIVRSEILDAIREKMIRFPVADTENASITVFLDPFYSSDRAFIRENIPQLNEAGVAVDVVLYPKDGDLESDSSRKLAAIWTIKDGEDKARAVLKAADGIRTWDEMLSQEEALEVLREPVMALHKSGLSKNRKIVLEDASSPGWERFQNDDTESVLGYIKEAGLYNEKGHKSWLYTRYIPDHIDLNKAKPYEVFSKPGANRYRYWTQSFLTDYFILSPEVRTGEEAAITVMRAALDFYQATRKERVTVYLIPQRGFIVQGEYIFDDGDFLARAWFNPNKGPADSYTWSVDTFKEYPVSDHIKVRAAIAEQRIDNATSENRRDEAQLRKTVRENLKASMTSVPEAYLSEGFKTETFYQK